MKIEELNPDRFKLKGALGEGADLQVYAAVDLETDLDVVVKRPHPTMVMRGQYNDIERRLERAMTLRDELGEALPYLSRIVGYLPSGLHEGYFGDSLGNDYTVVIEERARGLPLVGSAVDGIKGFPIGLPQKLFALYPLVSLSEQDAHVVAKAVLDLAEAFDGIGKLALDLRPQNVFFSPKDAKVTIIDIGNVAVAREATRRQPALDLHDFYLEMFKWYATPFEPPTDAEKYFEPYGMGSVQMFNQNLQRMKAEYSANAPEPLKTAAIGTLDKTQQRNYQSFKEFRAEFEGLLELVQARHLELANSPDVIEAWHSAKERLHEPYWQKFLFDSDTDLQPYSR